ncbi:MULTISPECIES: ABC transporter substrate-binding protein [Chryseobacterium]|uniref:ABC-type Fe3+-hydroxamate transport system substrate-binding protein n=1 Tax=Chryseobacterium camelliae TaxID=1265445 RepID=A0ABU0TE79_9FLAO|nr:MULTISPECIES: helical backbone metal receptor [Chryseobacterium]MDT3406821.1 ABC-type Fe3+-hydroxamate transport system substrate-binding protein [Pseudacidovorax intermedius]MDQ1095384.1 ABC-type Fe3+-hydroxamate transport system substrate-binding protein [Chryseobacterium camelliae]MDQ1099322.1 ABC-type Fe3+-hydroxamate transport system substrate-binding protein [Chryseobacterium sp. SORGH_AS_1048]MDR6086670.1 ABC-type Fe3+-hydroxamate transport system substrate-binding protein [Chryseobac
MNVISLVPSITEALFDLGLTEHHITGRTKFCIHPEDRIKNIPVIGGTKNLNLEKIRNLRPDLIIANKEENTKEQVETLMKEFKVVVTHVETVEDNYYLLKTLGTLFDCEEKAQQFNLKIYEVLESAKIHTPLKAAYLIWKNPYMTIGSDTFIHHILKEIGFENSFRDRTRYPEITVKDLADTDIIMLSSEPFPFREQHIEELKAVYPEKKIMIVDGEAFSWYGTHIAKCAPYFKELIDEVELFAK